MLWYKDLCEHFKKHNPAATVEELEKPLTMTFLQSADPHQLNKPVDQQVDKRDHNIFHEEEQSSTT